MAETRRVALCRRSDDWDSSTRSTVNAYAMQRLSRHGLAPCLFPPPLHDAGAASRVLTSTPKSKILNPKSNPMHVLFFISSLSLLTTEPDPEPGGVTHCSLPESEPFLLFFSASTPPPFSSLLIYPSLGISFLGLARQKSAAERQAASCCPRRPSAIYIIRDAGDNAWNTRRHRRYTGPGRTL